ncbi:RNA-binding protein 42-like [Sycon ciliatum]|uniref:RNA-binding protein 42-like n=1 Tax=Sycon ciliatum TaxID=27933 RepID=UPI0031F6A400
MAASNAASLAEEMSRFEEEISGARPNPGATPSTMSMAAAPPPFVAPQTSGIPTQAMPTGPPPGFMMPPSGPPPGMMMMPGPMPGPGGVPPPGVPLGPMPTGPPPGFMMPPGMMMMPGPGGLPPPGLPPGPMPTGPPPGMMAASSVVMPLDTLSDEQKKEWESQFSTGAAAGAQGKKKKKNLRTAAGVTWVDNTLEEWDESDFRIFAGDLGHECTDEVLFRAFSKYPSLKKCKIVRDNRTNKSRGFGFVSFKDPKDYLAAMKEMNGKYVAGRPIKLRKSTWKDRQLTVARKKQKEKERLGLK